MEGSDGNMELVVVGSGALRVVPGRGGTAAAVRVGGETWLFDCGRCAVQNLATFGLPVESVRRIFLTHLHFDHVCDLAHLLLLSWNNGREFVMPVTGPGGTADFLEHNLRRAYVADLATRLGKNGRDPAHFEWTVEELGAQDWTWRHGDTVLRAQRTPHGGIETYNYRIEHGGRVLVITGDTEWHDGLVEFCADADGLLIECSGTAEFLRSVPFGHWHLTPEKVGELATTARVKRVLMKHLVIESWVDDPAIGDRMVEAVRRTYAGPVAVATDGLRVRL
jgi:ribonuclease BN (tRNA processing enzyme)